MTFRTKTDIVIPAGSELIGASRKTERYTPHYEIIVGFGKDHTADFILDEEAVRTLTDLFEEVND